MVAYNLPRNRDLTVKDHQTLIGFLEHLLPLFAKMEWAQDAMAYMQSHKPSSSSFKTWQEGFDWTVECMQHHIIGTEKKLTSKQVEAQLLTRLGEELKYYLHSNQQRSEAQTELTKLKAEVLELRNKTVTPNANKNNKEQ